MVVNVKEINLACPMGAKKAKKIKLEAGQKKKVKEKMARQSWR